MYDGTHTASCHAAFYAGLYNVRRALQRSSCRARLPSHRPVAFRVDTASQESNRVLSLTVVAQTACAP